MGVALVALLIPSLVHAHPAVDRLEAALAGDLTAPCLTPYLQDVRAAWSELTPAERHRVDWATSPPYRALVAAGGPSWLEGEPWQDAPRDVCFPAEMISHDGQPYSSSLESDHFVLHWNAGGLTSDAEAESMVAALEYAWTRLIDELGWHPPEGTPFCQLVVAVEPMGGIAGYASGVMIQGQFRPFVVFNAGLLQEASDDTFRREVAAHELFHTIQYVYGYEEFILGAEQTPNRWWLEASATYQQGLTVPDGADYLEYFSLLWAQEPWVSMETHSGTGHQYGMFVWPLGIEASLDDGGAWHQLFWQQIEGRSGYQLRDEFDAFFGERDSSFLEQYGHWLALAAEGDLPRYDFLWGVRHLNRYAFIENSTTEEYTALDLPAEGRQDPGLQRSPEYLGAGFVWFGVTQAEESRALVMHFAGDAQAEGTDIEWAVEFAAVRNERVLDRFSATPVLSADGTGWEAHVRLEGIQENYDGAWMIASPITDFGEGTAGWGWQAEIRKGETSGGFSETGAGRGCTEGCAWATYGDEASAGFLLPALLLFRRRRSAGEPRRLDDLGGSSAQVLFC